MHVQIHSTLGRRAHLKALQRAIPPPVVDGNANGGSKLHRDACLLQGSQCWAQLLHFPCPLCAPSILFSPGSMTKKPSQASSRSEGSNVTHLELLKGETPAQTLLQVVLDGLSVHDGPESSCCWPWEDLLGLLSTGCRDTPLLRIQHLMKRQDLSGCRRACQAGSLNHKRRP